MQEDRQFVEVGPAYRTCSTLWGAVLHFGTLFHKLSNCSKKVKLFHFVSVFLDTTKTPYFQNTVVTMSEKVKHICVVQTTQNGCT